MVGLSRGNLSFSWSGAASPTLGMGATCFGGGDLKDWSSLTKESLSAAAAMLEGRKGNVKYV